MQLVEYRRVGDDEARFPPRMEDLHVFFVQRELRSAVMSLSEASAHARYLYFLVAMVYLACVPHIENDEEAREVMKLYAAQFLSNIAHGFMVCGVDNKNEALRGVFDLRKFKKVRERYAHYVKDYSASSASHETIFDAMGTDQQWRDARM